MFALTNVMHFFTHKFAGLCARSLALAFVPLGPLHGLLLRHNLKIRLSAGGRLLSRS